MSILAQFLDEVRNDLGVRSVVVEQTGPTINKGEEFTVRLTVYAKSKLLNYEYVKLRLEPIDGKVEVVNFRYQPDGGVVWHGADQGGWIETEEVELGRVGPNTDQRNYYRNQVVYATFRALKKTETRPPNHSLEAFCNVGLIGIMPTFACESRGNEELISVFRSSLLKCWNGHEYSVGEGFTDCPDCGLPLM
jgi:hypothetical protein